MICQNVKWDSGAETAVVNCYDDTDRINNHDSPVKFYQSNLAQGTSGLRTSALLEIYEYLQ